MSHTPRTNRQQSYQWGLPFVVELLQDRLLLKKKINQLFDHFSMVNHNDDYGIWNKNYAQLKKKTIEKKKGPTPCYSRDGKVLVSNPSDNTPITIIKTLPPPSSSTRTEVGIPMGTEGVLSAFQRCSKVVLWAQFSSCDIVTDSKPFLTSFWKSQIQKNIFKAVEYQNCHNCSNIQRNLSNYKKQGQIKKLTS